MTRGIGSKGKVLGGYWSATDISTICLYLCMAIFILTNYKSGTETIEAAKDDQSAPDSAIIME